MFKVGDKVLRTGPSQFGIKSGVIYTVRRIHSDNMHMFLDEIADSWAMKLFRAVKISNEEKIKEREAQYAIQERR
jgi:hypothetical protein